MSLSPPKIDPSSIELSGTEFTALDDKFRLALPKNKREHLGKDFVLAVGELDCLVLYPEATWEVESRRVRNLGIFDPAARQFHRLFFGTAIRDLNCDPQGRFVIPQMLREMAKITDKVALCGNGSFMEIWAQEEFEEYLKNQDNYGSSRKRAFEDAYRLTKGVEA